MGYVTLLNCMTNILFANLRTKLVRKEIALGFLMVFFGGFMNVKCSKYTVSKMKFLPSFTRQFSLGLMMIKKFGFT